MKKLTDGRRTPSDGNTLWVRWAKKRKFNTTFFKKWASYRLYRKWPPCIMNRTVPKIIVISVHTVNRFPITSYQVSVHLTKRFQRRRFKKNWPIKNKNCLWWPCLLTDRDEMCNLYRGPSIDAAYQVSVH